jgi:hypothetical protein
MHRPNVDSGVIAVVCTGVNGHGRCMHDCARRLHAGAIRLGCGRAASVFARRNRGIGNGEFDQERCGRRTRLSMGRPHDTESNRLQRLRCFTAPAQWPPGQKRPRRSLFARRGNLRSQRIGLDFQHGCAGASATGGEGFGGARLSCGTCGSHLN